MFHKHKWYMCPGTGCLECDCGAVVHPEDNPVVAKMERNIVEKTIEVFRSKNT